MSQELARKLGYQFNDEKLLKLALTHRSACEENNERLEFLGDSIVNFIMAEALYHQFVHAQEGDLSRWRATLINRDTLGDLARGFDIGRYMILGQGELRSGGGERASILSCTMEAVIGSIYLDGGFDKVRECVMRWYQPLLANLSHASNHKDPKTQLQEYLQRKHRHLPVYAVEEIVGEAHQQVFHVSCVVAGVKTKVMGQGSSRRKAEQDAAEIMLGILKDE